MFVERRWVLMSRSHPIVGRFNDLLAAVSTFGARCGPLSDTVTTKRRSFDHGPETLQDGARTTLGVGLQGLAGFRVLRWPIPPPTAPSLADAHSSCPTLRKVADAGANSSLSRVVADHVPNPLPWIPGAYRRPHAVTRPKGTALAVSPMRKIIWNTAPGSPAFQQARVPGADLSPRACESPKTWCSKDRKQPQANRTAP